MPRAARPWSTPKDAAPSPPPSPSVPSIGKNIALGYLPHDQAVKGKSFQVEYFGERYPVEVVGIGYEPLYDPENLKPRT